MSTCGYEGNWGSVVLAFPQARCLIRQKGTPQLQEPGRLSALLRDFFSAAWSQTRSEEWRCSAQELLQVNAGETAAQGRGFLVGSLSYNLQSWCFSNGEKADS